MIIMVPLDHRVAINTRCLIDTSLNRAPDKQLLCAILRWIDRIEYKHTCFLIPLSVGGKRRWWLTNRIFRIGRYTFRIYIYRLDGCLPLLMLELFSYFSDEKHLLYNNRTSSDIYNSMNIYFAFGVPHCSKSFFRSLVSTTRRDKP